MTSLNVIKDLPVYTASRSHKIVNFDGSDDDACNLELLTFWTLSIVWQSKEHEVSETGFVFFLR
jgi:hypothetical protein